MAKDVVPLSNHDRTTLASVATEIKTADADLNRLRREQDGLWRSLVRKGVTKTAIAEASGVSLSAINMRIAAPPSRLKRGG